MKRVTSSDRPQVSNSVKIGVTSALSEFVSYAQDQMNYVIRCAELYGDVVPEDLQELVDSIDSTVSYVESQIVDELNWCKRQFEKKSKK